MKKTKVYAGFLASLAGVVLIGSLVRSQAKGDAPTPVVVMNGIANPVPAADAIPQYPYFESLEIPKSISTTAALGPGVGTLAVTSLTITNASPLLSERVRIFVPVFGANRAPNSPVCSGKVTGGSTPQLKVVLKPMETLHLDFPSPLVIGPTFGATCLAVEQNSQNTEIHFAVNGYVRF